MSKWNQAIIIGSFLLGIGQQTWARDEIWQVTVWPAPWGVEYKSTWNMKISDAGEVTGVSTWDTDQATGKTNKISGRISKDGRITLTRHLADKHEGQTQEYTGQYSSDGLASTGATTGFDSPGSWTAAVIVKQE